MANACARNRPIALLVLSAEKRTCLQRQVCRRSCYDKKLNSKAMPTGGQRGTVAWKDQLSTRRFRAFRQLRCRLIGRRSVGGDVLPLFIWCEDLTMRNQVSFMMRQAH